MPTHKHTYLIILLAIGLSLVALAQSTINDKIFHAEKAIFERNYTEATHLFEKVLLEDSLNYKTHLYLAELYLLDGIKLADVLPVEMLHSYEKSIMHANHLLSIFDRDLNAMFYKMMANVELANTSSLDAIQYQHYFAAMDIANEALDIDFDDEKMWFAQGEWWYQIAQLPYQDRRNLLNQINKDFFGNIPVDKRQIYAFALDAYENALCKRPRSVYGLYGTIKVLLKLNRCEEADEYYKKLLHFTNLYPLQDYYANEIEFLWSECAKDENLDDDLPLPDADENAPIF